jgi:hypothetical protein
MNNKPFPKTLSRYVQIDKWIFEVKAVRAIRVEDFGKPYSAIANLTINGDSAYIDGLLAREEEDFTREDFQTFVKATEQLEVQSFNFDRFKHRRRISHTVKVTPVNSNEPKLKLVKM